MDGNDRSNLAVTLCCSEQFAVLKVLLEVIGCKPHASSKSVMATMSTLTPLADAIETRRRQARGTVKLLAVPVARLTENLTEVYYRRGGEEKNKTCT